MKWSLKARVAFVLAVPLSSVATVANDAVTEAQAIRLFLEESPQAQRGPAVVRSVYAGARVATRVVNLELSYQIEDAAGVRDEFLTFQQELPVTGRRGLLNDRAEAASSAAGLAERWNLQSDAYAMKRSLYEVLYRERVLDRLLQGADLLQHDVEILEQREREGEGSGYDALRAEQELAEVRMMTAEAEAALAEARSRFGSYFDPDLNMESARFLGDLASSGEVPQVDVAIQRALDRRLDLRALSAEKESALLEYRASRRRRFPEPTLTAGWKRVQALDLSDTGYIAALSVPLPIFDRGGPETARATADAQRVDLEAEILKRRIRAEVQATVAREGAARQAAQRYGQDVERRAVELRRIARLKYDEGESGILELLDAHRTSLAMELRALAARFEAKSARIQLDRATGIEVKP